MTTDFFKQIESVCSIDMTLTEYEEVPLYHIMVPAPVPKPEEQVCCPHCKKTFRVEPSIRKPKLIPEEDPVDLSDHELEQDPFEDSDMAQILAQRVETRRDSSKTNLRALYRVLVNARGKPLLEVAESFYRVLNIATSKLPIKSHRLTTTRKKLTRNNIA